MDLRQIFHDLNTLHFESRLEPPKLSWNSRLATTAGRFCPGSLSRGRPAEIEVATYLRGIEKGEEHIRDTMLHEMIHYWLWVRGRPYGHNAEFYAKMKATGAKRFNPVPKLRPVKHHYQCPGCQVIVPSRRKLGDVACSVCCKKHSGGRFDRRFRLALLKGAPDAIKPPLSPPSREEEDQRAVEEALECSFSFVTEQLSKLREIVQKARVRRSPPPSP